ncbi:MAG: hypothetical protein N2117_12790 [Anaerolineales bacterium]|nr:hypothetical protein [Anaerolineales bacterium]
MDLLGLVLRIPVLIIYMDESERVLRYRFCSLSEAIVLLQSQRVEKGVPQK